MRGQTLTTEPLSPGIPETEKSQTEQHPYLSLIFLQNLHTCFLERAGVHPHLGQSQRSAQISKDRVLHAPQNTVYVHQHPNMRHRHIHWNNTHSRMEASDLPGFLCQYISPVRAESRDFKPTHFPRGPSETTFPLFAAGGSATAAWGSPRLLRLFLSGVYGPRAAVLFIDQHFHLLCGRQATRPSHDPRKSEVDLNLSSDHREGVEGGSRHQNLSEVRRSLCLGKSAGTGQSLVREWCPAWPQLPKLPQHRGMG